MPRLGCLLVHATVLLLAVGCAPSVNTAGNNREHILGTWEHGDKMNETMEFGGDGRLKVANPKGKLPPIDATYTFAGDDTIDIVIAQGKGLQTDEGKQYLAASWMSFDHMNILLDGRTLTVRARFAATAEELSFTVGDQTTKYKRAK